MSLLLENVSYFCWSQPKRVAVSGLLKGQFGYMPREGSLVGLVFSSLIGVSVSCINIGMGSSSIYCFLILHLLSFIP